MQAAGLELVCPLHLPTWQDTDYLMLRKCFVSLCLEQLEAVDSPSDLAAWKLRSVTLKSLIIEVANKKEVSMCSLAVWPRLKEQENKGTIL